MGFHFASLIVHTADMSRICARQASRNSSGLKRPTEPEYTEVRA